jgi:hypothetical protein
MNLPTTQSLMMGMTLKSALVDILLQVAAGHTITSAGCKIWHAKISQILNQSEFMLSMRSINSVNTMLR